MQLLTLQLCIAGLVQGVGFRDALRQEAERRGVTGWVRNRASGEVEAVVQGNPASVQEVLAWAKRGPPGARVDRLECQHPRAEHAIRYARFERWPTV